MRLAVAALWLLHLTLFLTLQARPGRIAIALWTWGPPLLIIATAVVLLGVLRTTLKGRHGWTVRGAVDLAALLLLIASIGVYRTFPSSHDDAPSRVQFRLPLDGPVTVAWGGRSAAVNYHVGVPAERWAYDLLVTANGRSHRGDGASVNDFFAYDRPIRSPSAGLVVHVHDGDPDAVPGRRDVSRSAGNHVVLEVAPDQYLVIAHLRAGTLRAARGQRVARGDVLGHVGNSGNSSEPHVHIHLQDDPAPGHGEGIPLYFSDYVIVRSGEARLRASGASARQAAIAHGMPQGGMRRGQYIGDVVASRAP
jgi:hypothetical protein